MMQQFINLPLPVRRDYADATQPVINDEQIDEMGAFIAASIDLHLGGSAWRTASGEVARALHVALDLAYNNATQKYGGTFLHTAASVGIGDLVIFATPATVPSNALQAVLSLPVGGVDTDFPLAANFSPISNDDLVPNLIYWGRFYAGLSIQLLNPPGRGAIERRIARTITNAEFKTLDTDYIELIPDPGPGNYVQIEQAWVRKNGVDVYVPAVVPPPTYFRGTAVLPVGNDDLTDFTQAVADTGNSVTDSAADPATPAVPTWVDDSSGPFINDGTARWIFFGVHVDETDVSSGSVFTADRRLGGGLSSADRVPGTFLVGGLETKWFRMGNVLSQWNNLALTFFSLARPPNTLTARESVARMDAGFIFNPSAAERPLTRTEGIEIAEGIDSIFSVLARTSGQITAKSISEFTLKENRGITLGAYYWGYRGDIDNLNGGYNAALWDTYFTDINDVSLDIILQYQIHNVFEFD